MAGAQQPALPWSGPGGTGHWCCSAQSRSAFLHAGLNRKRQVCSGEGAPCAWITRNAPGRPALRHPRNNSLGIVNSSVLDLKIRLRFLQCTRRGKQML